MEGLGVALTARLTFLKVQREERQDGYPKLVPLRGEVQPNEGRTPRELNSFKFHTRCPAKKLPAVWPEAADFFATSENTSCRPFRKAAAPLRNGT